MKYLILFSIISLVCSCRQTSDGIQSQLIVADLTQDYPPKRIELQDIADITYIPLATADSMLVNSDFSVVSNDGIVVRGGKIGEILLFDKQGQTLQGRICRRGQGPEEYTAIIHNIVDWERKEVFIGDYKSLKVYDFQGNYLRTLIRDNDMMMLDIGNLNRDYLLCGYNNSGSEEPYQPYFSLSKENGKTDTLTIEIPRFIASNRKVEWDDGYVTDAYGYLPNLYKCADKIYLTNVALDTIFAIQPDQTRIPVMIPLQAPTQDEEAPLLYLRGINDHYAWTRKMPRHVKVQLSNMMNDPSFLEKTYMYDRHTGEWFEPIYRNRAISNRKMDPKFINTTSVPYGYGLIILNAMDLVEAYENNQITDEKLKNIASKLQEEDNPVLMLLKFKG
ncbi:MAG: 6-bladed beta-propeller [Parabacteroides sp.]|nr:6-bladed beta-propeller [Parabacteroides sp.]